MSGKQERPRKRLPGRLAIAWLILVAAFFLWQSIVYGSLIDRIAEWQFARFDRYFPALTYFLFVAIAALPVLVHLALRWRDARAARGEDAGGGRAIASAVRWMRICFAFAGLAVLTAIGVLLTVPSTAGDSGSVQQVDVAQAARGDFAEGRSELHGNPDFSRIAGYGQNLLVTRFDTYFAPVHWPLDDRGVTRMFVELKRLPGRELRFSAPGVGALRRDALPGEIEALFRKTGLKIGEPHYVLFLSDRFQRWRHYVVAAQIALAAAIFAIFALWQRRRRDKLRAAGRSARDG